MASHLFSHRHGPKKNLKISEIFLVSEMLTRVEYVFRQLVMSRLVLSRLVRNRLVLNRTNTTVGLGELEEEERSGPVAGGRGRSRNRGGGVSVLIGAHMVRPWYERRRREAHA